MQKLSHLLDRIDKTLVTRKQKLLLYKAGLCPRLNWDLSILEMPISWVNNVLEDKASRYLKKWSGLARSADPSILYLPKCSGGLELPSTSLLYKKLQSSQAALLLSSRDPVTQHVATIKLKREEQLHRPKFQPMTFVCDVMAEDPGVIKRGLVMRSKARVTKEDTTTRRDHAESLPRQGQMMRLAQDEAEGIWSTAVCSLDSECLKFALNAATDTLPHNANLAVWRMGQGISDKCKLCERKQTLIHVLNDCPIALKLRRYNHRHDSVLTKIVEFVETCSLENTTIIYDLPDNPYQFPPHISTTDLRPDIVIWSNSTKELTIVELTVCFETSFNEAISRKTLKYINLMEEAQTKGYNAQILTLEVGSRSILNLDGFMSLRELLQPLEKILPTSSQHLPGPAFHNHTRFGAKLDRSVTFSNFNLIFLFFYFNLILT